MKKDETEYKPRRVYMGPTQEQLDKLRESELRESEQSKKASLDLSPWKTKPVEVRRSLELRHSWNCPKCSLQVAHGVDLDTTPNGCVKCSSKTWPQDLKCWNCGTQIIRTEDGQWKPKI